MPNVILVDDEIWTIRCLESLLADYPAYHVVGSFSDGQEALAYLRLNPCDVVFTDLRMDRMSGRKLISVCVQEKYRCVWSLSPHTAIFPPHGKAYATASLII